MYDEAQADSLEIAFPNLKSTNYAVISPTTRATTALLLHLQTHRVGGSNIM